MGEVRAAYTELRFFGKIDEPSRYRRGRSTGTPENRPTPDRFNLTFTVSSHDRGSDVKKKENRLSVIYRLISGLFYRPSESDWKEKKGAFVVSFH